MFKKVAVIGAGTMGSGIAGQIANAGVDVYLFDLRSDGDDPNSIARGALEKLQNSEPSGLMSAEAAERIRIGNIEDDLHRVAECDWVAEAVVEVLDIKHRLYAELAGHLQNNALLTSNTSTIPIHLLTRGMSKSLKQRFAITHFFNPVRFMRLLELVGGEFTQISVMQHLEKFSEKHLGKGVVRCKDTPGFLANRVGVYAIQCALHEAVNANLPPPVADALFGRPMGIPKTGVFGLYDLIGIDLMSDVVASLVNILPKEDAFHVYSAPIELMTEMILNGKTGNKQGRGFYFQPASSLAKQVMDFSNGSYVDFNRPVIKLAIKAELEGVFCLLDDDSQYGRYAWRVLSQTLSYAASLIPEVGYDPRAIDDAMKLGYNWIKGPFELLDEIGLDYFVCRLQQEERAVPTFLAPVQTQKNNRFYRVKNTQLQTRHWRDEPNSTEWRAVIRESGLIRFNETRQTLKPINSNDSASWYNYQEIALVEFHSKANTLDDCSMALLADALGSVSKQGLKGLILHNDAQHFSCGVNLESVRGFFRNEDFQGLDQFLMRFQQTVHGLAKAQFPVVAAPCGMSVGGGFEVVLHAQHVVAHANSVLGLVESLVGLIPGGGGCKEMLYRWVEKLGSEHGDITEAAWKAFMSIGYGRTATSPLLARELAMLRDDDQYLMNRDRLLAAAVDYVYSNRTAIHQHRPKLAMPGREVFMKMGEWLHKANEKGMITPHDIVVGRAVASVMTGGDIDPETQWTEQDLYDAERNAFVSLVRTQATQARINSMLDLGRSLRN